MTPMPLHLHRLFSLALSASMLAFSAIAATPAATKPAAKPAAKSAPKPAPRAVQRPTAKATPAASRRQADNTAKGLALATATVEAISAGQLDVAARVLTGAADCEFNQRITVLALDGQPGYFTVSHQGRHYRMLPRETSTGAVRLEDPANGVVWLQIPAKSMLMNARRGQRMVDSCLHAEQRAALAAVTEAGQGIGIVTPLASVPPVATVAPAVAVVPALGASAPATSASAPAVSAPADSAPAPAVSAPAPAASAPAAAASAPAPVVPASPAASMQAPLAPSPPAAVDATPTAPAPAASAP